ncbi:hypothetical protein GOQ27_11595 [Clostridium sp. D2Q-11]|uniref:Uncharacterized protein n=1 Tax=Anaeromonas frigoriresistens TaxID=2683708 RepID=A0A942UX00_9FIRM|nr:hypothetical protein [Anaeromonas frigoriresistens]MBS4539110.1 hypothetical protein [Anaeromonas frigoriresistens]
MNQDILYPEIYRKIYPKVEDTIMRYYPYDSPMNEMPAEEEIDKMIDEIYEEVINDYPEIEEDIRERRVLSRGVTSQQRPYYGRRRLFRDLIGLTLLGSLFNRRRRRYPYYPGYGDYPYYPGYGNYPYYPGYDNYPYYPGYY